MTLDQLEKRIQELRSHGVPGDTLVFESDGSGLLFEAVDLLLVDAEKDASGTWMSVDTDGTGGAPGTDVCEVLVLKTEGE